MTPHILVPSHKDCLVRQEGTQVQVILEGHLLLDLTWESALILAAAIRQQAKKAEELAHADSVIMDQAILMRVGSPIGLVTRPDMAKEAAKEAAWNTPLRRYIRKNRMHHHGIVYAASVRHAKKKE